MTTRRQQRSKHAGQKSKLPGLKVVGGKNHTPIKDAVSEDDVFDPPQHLNVHGAAIWRSAVRQLTIIGELSVDHLYGLHELAHLWQRMYKKMEADEDIDHKTHEAFRKLMIEYGMTPASRQRMDPTGVGRVKKKRHTDEPDAKDQQKEAQETAPSTSIFAALRQQVSDVTSTTKESA